MASNSSATQTPVKPDEKVLVKEPTQDEKPGGLFFNPDKLYPPSRTKEITLTVQYVKDEGEGKAAQLVTENVFLRQGLNIAPAAHIALVGASYIDYVARGAVELVELGDTVGDGVALVLKSLANLSDAQAIKAASFERDRAVLNQWLTVEPRPAVVQAINQRISVLTKGASI